MFTVLVRGNLTNTCCAYILEVLMQGASSEYPQHMFFFCREIRKMALRSAVDPGGFLRRLDLIILPYSLYILRQTGLSKQCRLRSDATKCAVWSGSTLFATHPTILHTFSDSIMDLLKRSIRKSIPNFSMKMKFTEFIQTFPWKWNLPNLSKLSHENEILS